MDGQCHFSKTWVINQILQYTAWDTFLRLLVREAPEVSFKKKAHSPLTLHLLVHNNYGETLLWRTMHILLQDGKSIVNRLGNFLAIIVLMVVPSNCLEICILLPTDMD